MTPKQRALILKMVGWALQCARDHHSDAWSALEFCWADELHPDLQRFQSTYGRATSTAASWIDDADALLAALEGH